MATRNPTLGEFLAALDTVKRFVVLLEPLLGAPRSEADHPGRPVSETPVPAISPSGKRFKSPKNFWQKPIRELLEANGKGMTRAQIVQAIADIQNKSFQEISGIVGRTLYEMKARRKLSHNKNTGIFRLLSTEPDPAAVVVERHHADT